MAETDALGSFDWGKVTKPSLFLKFQADKPLTLRVLTVDPIVQQISYEGDNGEETLSTKFAFVVYNFTEEIAQVLSATANMAKKIGELHVDPDFGGNIRDIDIKITPTGEKLKRRYDIQVLPKAQTLTNAQIKECAAIDLEKLVPDGQRMSFYDPDKAQPKPTASTTASADDIVVEDIDDEEPINLDDIPF